MMSVFKFFWFADKFISHTNITTIQLLKIIIVEDDMNMSKWSQYYMVTTSETLANIFNHKIYSNAYELWNHFNTHDMFFDIFPSKYWRFHFPFFQKNHSSGCCDNNCWTMKPICYLRRSEKSLDGLYHHKRAWFHPCLIKISL